MYKSQLRWMFEGLILVGQVVKVVRQASATDLLISETTGKPLKQFQVIQGNNRVEAMRLLKNSSH